MVDRVAYHVQERIANLVDDCFIQFRVLALRFQVNLFSQTMAEIADNAGHLLEGSRDWHHSPREAHFLQIANDFSQLNESTGFCVRMEASPVLFHHRRANHHLTDLIDHFIETITVDSLGFAGR